MPSTREPPAPPGEALQRREATNSQFIDPLWPIAAVAATYTIDQQYDPALSRCVRSGEKDRECQISLYDLLAYTRKRINRMETKVLIFPAAGFFAGVFLGWVFGSIHDVKFIVHGMLRRFDEFAVGWVALPAPFARSIFLVVMLTWFQTAVALLFDDGGIPWIMSAGVLLGYAWTLVRQIHRRVLATEPTAGGID